jgi:hypothetical protein
MRRVRYLVVAAAACAANPPAHENVAERPPAAEAPPSGSAATLTPPSTASTTPAPTPAATNVTGNSPASSKRFPPADIAPPHPRSAQADDGKWAPFPAGSPFAKTVLHPHEASRFIAVTIVAIDLASVSVHYMPGTEDLGGRQVPFTAGLVPVAEHDRLLAVFNGGFQPRHGHWGMKLGETTVVPPRDEGCTVALGSDGAVRLRSWSALAASAADFVAFRQTPPCLVEERAVHPDLLAGRDKAWAGQAKDLVTRRRSALGLDESGAVLFYAIGVEASPRLLAEALRFAGAENAAELDINWNWTRFLLYERDRAGKLRVSESLAEGEVSKSGYVERPSERDFFYLLRR